MSLTSFEEVCTEASLPLCSLVEDKLQPVCFARNVELGDALLFQAATSVVLVMSLAMAMMMIYHIKSKFTAVGRKEMVMFFYIYLLHIIMEFLLVFGVIPPASGVYPFFVAIGIGVTTAMLWCLFLNGFVGFQWAEDGTPLSLWTVRLSSLVVFAASFFIALATFLNIVGLSAKNPAPLFIVVFGLHGLLILVYIITQVVLVLKTLDNRWPLGDIFFGVVFFAIGQLCLYSFSNAICDLLEHYMDGMFFAASCNLLTVMMVYKYWDSITKEDLEFSVGARANLWEVREPLINQPPAGASGGPAPMAGGSPYGGPMQQNAPPQMYQQQPGQY